MKILIVGSAGFVGCTLSRKLKEHRLICLDSLKTPALINNIYHNKNHDFYVADIANLDIIKNILVIEKPDVIINTVAPKNISMVGSIFELVKLAKVSRFFQFSYGFYDQMEKRFHHPEKFEEVPIYLLEQALWLHPEVVFVRAPNLFGPRQNGTSAIPNLIRAVLADTGEVFKASNEMWLYINDLVSAIEFLLKQTEFERIYQVLPSKSYSFEYLVALVNSLKAGTSLPEVPVEIQKLLPRSSNIRSLGWQETKLEDKVVATYQWYLNNQWFFKG